MTLHHTTDPICPLCEEKLKGADPRMVAFFRWVKGNHPDCHCAWAFRGQADQDHMLQMRLTKAPWPQSRHNKTDANGNPRSQALDLFQLVAGQAVFDNGFYRLVFDELTAANMPIEWAGTWTTFKEMDHYQTREVSS